MTDTSVHAGRRERLRRLLAQHGVADPLAVSDLANVRYLTGFTGSNAVLLLGRTPDADVLGTDGRYRDQVATEAPDLPVIIDRDTLVALLGAAGAGRVAVESSLPVGAAEQVRRRGCSITVAPDLVQELRRIKDAGEIAELARACAITVQAFAQLAVEIRIGETELALARRLEQLFGELGAEDRAFDSIVATGAGGALPHHQPGSARIGRGDLLVIDAGARVAGYHADMTRTFIVGADPVDWQVEIHALVLEAQRVAAQACRPGADARGLHELAAGVIDAGGFGDAFTHGLGHGVGLVIHEAPNIGPRATGTIEADMAITVEPGIYLPGRGGVRIEDTLVVTDSGPSILTEAPRDLVVVG